MSSKVRAKRSRISNMKKAEKKYLQTRKKIAPATDRVMIAEAKLSSLKRNLAEKLVAMRNAEAELNYYKSEVSYSDLAI